MNYIECPECGSKLPQDSNFCNKCGAKIVHEPLEVKCPHCYSKIPSGSVFCPNCGKKVSEPEVISSRSGGIAAAGGASAASARQKPDAWQDEPSRASRARAVEPTQYGMPDNDDDFEDSPLRMPSEGEIAAGSGDHRTRNIIIAAVLVGFLALFFMSKCQGSKKTRDWDNATDTTQVVSDNNQSTEIFLKALQDNNLMGDRANVAYAMRFPGANTGTDDKIVGISYLSSDTHPFYKIYELTPNGEAWNIELKDTKYLDGRNITFDQGRLKANEDAIPMSPEIDGKRYFFFAYLSTPTSTSSQGQVVLNLYDIEQHKVVSTMTYDGSFTNRDGEQVIVSNPRSNGGAMQNWMEDQVRSSIGLVHIKTQEEIDEEKKAEEEKEEEEKKDTPEGADEQWKDDNAGKMTEAMKGDEVQFNQEEHDKDKPLFRASDIQKKIQGGSYTIFLTKDGKVYSFNKSNNKNTLLYAGASKAQDIGWENSANGILNIRTANGRLQYNVTNGKAVMKKDKEEEPRE